MKVTSVDLKPVTQGKIRAYANVTFDGILVVRGIKIIEGAKGLFVAMPAKPDKKDPKKYWDDVSIVGATKPGTPGDAFYKEFQAAVLSKYQGGGKTTQQAQNPTPDFNQTGDDKVPF